MPHGAESQPTRVSCRRRTYGHNILKFMSSLGFTYSVRNSGDVEISHHGRMATTLRGKQASDFLAKVSAGDDSAAQQLMARLTGNYKRGNERKARNHPRNQ